jgi:hypothetical protein
MGESFHNSGTAKRSTENAMGAIERRPHLAFRVWEEIRTGRLEPTLDIPEQVLGDWQHVSVAALRRRVVVGSGDGHESSIEIHIGLA